MAVSFTALASPEQLASSARRMMLKKSLRSHPGPARSFDACDRQGYENSRHIVILPLSRWYLSGYHIYQKCSQEPGRKQKEHIWKFICGWRDSQTHWNGMPSLLLPHGCYFMHTCLLGMLRLLCMIKRSKIFPRGNRIAGIREGFSNFNWDSLSNDNLGRFYFIWKMTQNIYTEKFWAKFKMPIRFWRWQNVAWCWGHRVHLTKGNMQESPVKGVFQDTGEKKRPHTAAQLLGNCVY